MSSPRAAVKAARKPIKPVPAPRKKASALDASQQAMQIADEIERGLHAGQQAVSEEAQQKLLAALCRSYSQQVQAGGVAPAISPDTVLSATDVMITASALLKAADLQVFELGMWQSWTGR